MKKIISLFMVLTMVLSLAACSTNQSPSESTPEESSSQTNESTPTPSNTNGKNLVVYFSMPDNVDDSTVVIDGETLGNTQYMAYVIQETVGADIFRIEPETPYPTDHDELVDLASEEQSNNARPAIKDTIENFDTYENIFVGYPNWWGDMPMILYSFFDEYDFSGKTIILFNTHGGSGFSGTISTIKELEPNAEVLDGKSISRNDIQDAEQEIVDWVNSLALSACGKQNNDTTANNTDTNVSNNNVTDDNTDDSADITPEESTAGDSNILVAYFSWSGNTQQVANWISDKTGGELFRIIPEVEYTMQTYIVEGRQVLVVTIEETPHKPVYAKDENGKPLAYLRIKDENILATPIHLRVWQQSDSPRGELIRYTEREQLLLDQLEQGNLLSLNRYCRRTGLSRRAAEHLLAKFVRYDIVEPVFENHKFYFRIKNE